MLKTHCPYCLKNAYVFRVSRTWIEKLIYKEYQKFQCTNCKSIFLFSLRTEATKLIKAGEIEKIDSL